MRLVRFLTALYSLLLKLYPGDYRATFAEEMRLTFADVVTDAAGQSRAALLVAVWREFRRFPLVLWRRCLLAPKGGEMNADATAGRSAQAPLSGGEVAAGLLPFLLIGAAGILNEWPGNRGAVVPPVATLLGHLLFASSYLLVAVGLGVAWTRGFPRWSYPYISVSLLYAFYMSRATYNIPLFRSLTGPHELLGWRAWLPLVAAAAVALLFTRSLRPIRRLLADLWQDWTRLCFLVYALVPFGAWVITDEMDHSFAFPLQVTFALALCGGAWLYLRGERLWPRVSALAAATAAFLILESGGALLYGVVKGREWTTVPAVLISSAVVLALVCVPGMALGILRRAVTSRRLS